MRIEDRVFIKGRGWLATVRLDDTVPAVGMVAYRDSDGASWDVVGVERHAIHGWAFPGAPVGLLLRGEDEFAPGDEIEVTELERGPFYYPNLGPLPAVAGVYGDDTTVTVRRGVMRPSGNEVFQFLAFNGERYGYTIAARQLFEHAGVPVIPIVCHDCLWSMLEGTPDMSRLTTAQGLL